MLFFRWFFFRIIFLLGIVSFKLFLTSRNPMHFFPQANSYETPRHAKIWAKKVLPRIVTSSVLSFSCDLNAFPSREGSAQQHNMTSTERVTQTSILGCINVSFLIFLFSPNYILILIFVFHIICSRSFHLKIVCNGCCTKGVFRSYLWMMSCHSLFYVVMSSTRGVLFYSFHTGHPPGLWHSKSSLARCYVTSTLWASRGRSHKMRHAHWS